MKSERRYSFLDQICLGIDQTLRALTDNPKTTGRFNPGRHVEEQLLNEQERKQSASLMRVNHAGEICAQALYHGQSIVSRSYNVREGLQKAAIEEGDHLNWCKQRLTELNSHTSYLNPLWYVGSFGIGMMAGLVGDKWSLGFIAETEYQVIKHLEGHLHLLPAKDHRSFKILQQMEQDEAKHREEAIASGAQELPKVIRKGMSLVSKVMVTTAYYL